MKKNGFVSTSLIYTFFILFLLLMIFLLNSYSSVRFLLDRYKYDIKNSFAESTAADINLYFMVWNQTTQEYEIQDNIPPFGYNFEENISYCKNGSKISYTNGNIMVRATRNDTCYAYFKEVEKDIILNIYTKNSSTSERVFVKNIPNYSYELTSKNCTNGAVLTFDEELRKFTVQATQKTVCEVEFTKKQMDIDIHLFKQDIYGNHEFESIKYQEVSDIPVLNYDYYKYSCVNKDVNTVISWNSSSRELSIESSGKNECNVYFKGGTNKVEVVIMQETDDGVSGYTTGKKYSRIATIPGTGYKYVGYICDTDYAKVTYNNGTLSTEVTGDIDQAVCRAYFNRYNGNVYVRYYLEKSNGEYEEVGSVPSIGYVYNSSKSKCNNNSTIIVDNNVVIIDATDEDECNIYYDMTNADIKVNVYVMNKQTLKYELGKIPIAGYQFYNSGCTNGATIEYVNGALNVMADGPTVCTVYFR